LTKSEGWYIDHSLKDFGTRDCNIAKLQNIADLEANFDKNWSSSKDIN